jgi:branched-chain amino acid aminotransferase
MSQGMLNGKLLPLDQLQIAVQADGFQYGLGVFTTAAVEAGRVRWLEAHAERLERDAAALGLAYTAGGLGDRCARVVAAGCNGVKVVVFADDPGVSELILPRPHAYTAEVLAQGRRLQRIECAGRRGARLAQVKHLNYAEHLLATRKARAAGYDDALWVDQSGMVLEAATASLFIVRGGQVITPPLSEGVLAGVTRAKVLGLGATFGLCERPVPWAWLEEAEEVFVTNALAGVMAVRAVDQRVFRWGPETVTARIAAALGG